MNDKPTNYPSKLVRRRAALEVARASEGLEVVRLVVAKTDVVYVKGILEASDGLACMFCERGGDLLLAAPASRARDLHALVADLVAELGCEQLPAPERAGLELVAREAPRPSSPVAALPELDPRVTAAWGQWLAALATDAEAALAAAQVYAALDGPARDALLDALSLDLARLGVPRVAVFAPLLAVERDPARADRISRELALAEDASAEARSEAAPAPAPRRAEKARAYRGLVGGARRPLVIVAPLYLDFVRVLRCRCSPGDGFDAVELEALSDAEHARTGNERFAGAPLERVPLEVAIEELSLAILAQRRRGVGSPGTELEFAL